MKSVLSRLRLGMLLDVLPQRLTLARQQKMPHQDFLLLLLSDEVSRRESNAITIRAQRAHLDPEMCLEKWSPDSEVTYDRELFNELASLRFLTADLPRHVTIAGPVGVGKTFKAHALGHLACAAGHSVYAARTDHMLKNLRHARLDGTHEAELRKLINVDLLILDDFGMDALGPEDSRDVFELMTERNRKRSIIVTSNRGPDEWLAAFAEPVRGQAAIDRFTNNSYDLVMDGPSYRNNLKPKFTPSKGTKRPRRARSA
jgi:DNA replication protein DnaC